MLSATTLFHERPFSSTVLTFILLYFHLFTRPVGAVLRNVSIDDQKGDWLTGQIPTYAPGDGAWANELCAGCAVKPDTDQLFDHTAMASTYMQERNPSLVTADFDFNGTAIYIFFTLFYNEGNGTAVQTECNFTLDNEAPVFFNHYGDPTVPIGTKRDYHALVFSKAGLEYKPHHMRISMSDLPYHVFLSFDYALYTIDAIDDLPTPTTSQAATSVKPSQSSSISSSTETSNASKPAVGAIVGGILGGLAVLIVFIGLLWFYRRGRNHDGPSSPDPATPRPFVHLHSVSSAPQTAELEGTFARSSTGAIGSPSFKTPGSPQARDTSGLPSSPLTSPSPNSRTLSVKHRLQDAHQCVQSMTAESALSPSRMTQSRATSPRTTDELMEEIGGLRREIQVLEQSRGPGLDLPPEYDE